MTQLATDDHEDKLMGEQLSAEFKEAVNGMWRVVRVGAMVMTLRERLMSKLDIRNLPRGKNAHGQGLNAWLDQYAPDVERSTAYRFEDVTKAVAKSFELPARVAKRLTFEEIVTAPENELDPAALKVREQINGFVAGTSQKSWLDQFREAADKGGARNRKCPHCAGAIKSKKVSVCPHCGKDPSTPPSEEEQKHTEALEAWTLLSTEAHDRAFGEGIYKAEWDLLTTAELAEIDARLFRVHELFRDAIKARKGR